MQCLCCLLISKRRFCWSSTRPSVTLSTLQRAWRVPRCASSCSRRWLISFQAFWRMRQRVSALTAVKRWSDSCFVPCDDPCFASVFRVFVSLGLCVWRTLWYPSFLWKLWYLNSVSTISVHDRFFGLSSIRLEHAVTPILMHLLRCDDSKNGEKRTEALHFFVKGLTPPFSPFWYQGGLKLKKNGKRIKDRCAC